MISSMTGFGRGSAQSQNKKIKVEIKSLNSKQLDLSIRIPSYFREQEVGLRAPIAEQLERGKVDVMITVENLTHDNAVSLNTGILKYYKEEIERLGKDLNLQEPADWYSVLLRLPDVMKSENNLPDEEDSKALYDAFNEAIASLKEFRKEEGRKLYGFFIEKVENIGNLLEETGKYEEQRVPKIRQRLEEQLSHLSSIEYDRGRLEQELIFYIEKLDVSEEKLRLKSHLNYFLETLGQKEQESVQGQGKKLGFIAQEMGREINTLGSKSNDAEMQRLVVRMKDELEQIKEQVLNVL